MKHKLSNLIASLFILASSPALTPAQEAQPTPTPDGQKVIEDFTQTRGVIFVESGKKSPPKPASRPQPARKGSAAAGPKQGAKPAPGPTPPADAAAPKADAAGKQAGPADATLVKASLRPIGIGYTLLMNDEARNPVVVDTTREFKEDDAVRLELETNTDAYLYVFNTEDGRNPVMLLPNVKHDGGNNWVAAHSRQYFPADLDYGFIFDDKPATERLYIIVSRKPLEGVPTGQDLLTFCGAAEECHWKPSPAEWDRIKAGADGVRTVASRNTQLARLHPNAPAPALRGMKLKKTDPAPAFVRMNERPEADVLVATIDLVHK